MRDPLASTEGDVGVTSLALTCFLDLGFTPASKQSIVDIAMNERHKIGGVIDDGVRWLVKEQGADGAWAPSTVGLENQSLATWVLTESLRLTCDPQFRAPAEKAVEALLRAQLLDPTGPGRWGWAREGAPGAADVSSTAWAVRALASARLAGLDVEELSIAGAAAFADHAWTGAAGSARDNSLYVSLARLRLLTRPDLNDPVHARATQAILDGLPEPGEELPAIDGTSAYDEAFVIGNVHGNASSIKHPKVWQRWSRTRLADLLRDQDDTPKSCRHGGWLSPDPARSAAGPTVCTSFTILASSFGYRFESMFQTHRVPPPRPR